MKLSDCKLYLIIFLLIACIPYCTYSQIDGNNWNKSIPIEAEIDDFINTDIDDNCSLPLNLINRFNGKVDTVNNINKAGEIILNNKDGGYVKISGDVYIAPQFQISEIRKVFREELEVVLNEKIVPSIRELSENVLEIKAQLNEIAMILKTTQKPNEKKREILNLLIIYQNIVNFTKCVHQDYKDEAVIRTDTNGQEIYLFDIEKIGNDPNYFFKGEEKEGFKLVKQFNKYGYQSKTDEYSDIPFKYDDATDFTNGYAIVRNNMSYHVIDRKGNELLSFSTANTTFIEILENGLFIKHGMEEPSSKDSYFIDERGNIISEKFDKIVSYDHKNIFKGIPELKKRLVFGANSSISKKPVDSLERDPEVPSPPIDWGTYYDYNRTFYLDNQGDRILLSFKDLKKVKKTFKLKGKLTYWFEQIMLLPNNTEMLFIINIKGNEYLLLKDLISKEISILKDVENIDSYFKIAEFPKKISDSYSHSILGYSLSEHYNMYNSIIIDNKAFTKLKMSYSTHSNLLDSNKNNLRVFNIIENKSIGPLCQKINGVFPKRKLILFGKTLSVVSENENHIPVEPYNESQESLNESEGINAGDLEGNNNFENITSYNLKTGYGVMTYNGQIVIPPLFKEIIYQEDENYFYVLDYFENSYRINDMNWNCIQGDCVDYRQLIREYFPLIEED